jgi:hypothetical protein
MKDSLRHVLLMGIAVLVSGSSASAGRKPKPGPGHGPSPEIKRIAAEIEKLQKEQQALLAKVQARYAAEVAALRIATINAELARLRREKTGAVYKKADPVKLKVIQDKYQPQIQALSKNVKNAETQTAVLSKQKKAELAKVRAAYRTQIAKVDPAEVKLEILLARAEAQAAAAAYKLIDAAKVADLRAKFQSQISNLRKRIRERDALLALLDPQLNAQMTAVSAFYQARIAELELAAERPGLQMVRLLEAKAFSLANATGAKQRDEINATYNGKIATVQQAIDAKNQRVATLVMKRDNQMAALRAAYQAELAKIVAPDVLLEAELALVWADQRAALLQYIAAVELDAFRATYISQIESLQARVRTKQATISRLNRERDALLAKIEADYLARLALLNPPGDLFQYQLLRLQERQWLETVWLFDPLIINPILAEYDGLIVALLVQLQQRQGRLAPLGQRAQADINRIVNDYNRRIAGLQQQILRLLSK